MLAENVRRTDNGYKHTTVRTHVSTGVCPCPAVLLDVGNSQQSQIQQEQQQQEQQQVQLAQHCLEMSDRGGKT